MNVVELRRYTLKPGARETLVELFDREFVESQEALGMRILGTFRDLDDPDQFVWLRGFDDMASRAPALTAFYTGPVWKAHSAAANETMVDVDNVLLLRPAEGGPALEHDPARRPPAGAPERDGMVWVTISAEPVPGDALARFVTEHARTTSRRCRSARTWTLQLRCGRPSRRRRARSCGSCRHPGRSSPRSARLQPGAAFGPNAATAESRDRLKPVPRAN